MLFKLTHRYASISRLVTWQSCFISLRTASMLSDTTTDLGRPSRNFSVSEERPRLNSVYHAESRINYKACKKLSHENAHVRITAFYRHEFSNQCKQHKSRSYASMSKHSKKNFRSLFHEKKNDNWQRRWIIQFVQCVSEIFNTKINACHLKQLEQFLFYLRFKITILQIHF